MNTNESARFLIEYDSLNHERSDAHFALAIPDGVAQSPANGWTLPPFPVPARVTDHGRQR